MFSLHESTQRTVTRILFVLCAVLPAIATVVWIAYANRPWREYDWQQDIAQQLHVQVQVEGISTPRPGITHLNSVSLADLRTHQPLGTFKQVQVHWQRTRWLIEAERLQVSSKNLAAIGTSLQTALSSSDLPACQLHVEDLEVVGTQQTSVRFANLHCQATSNNQVRKLSAQAEMISNVGHNAATNVRLLVDQQGTITAATIDTGGGQMPVVLLHDLLPSLAGCSETSFSGIVRLEDDGQCTTGSLRGRVGGLPIKELCATADATISTVANVNLDQLKWTDERVEVAYGTVKAEKGEISLAFLNEMRSKLYCRPGTLAASATGTELAFDEMSCGFHLTGSGLTLTGRCQSIVDGAPGCMIARGGQAILREPEYSNLPVALMVQVFARPDATWLPSIPGSHEANEMAGSLPLPRVGPRPTQESDPELAGRPKDTKSK